MVTAELLTPAISETLTWTEICDRHPKEWVCLVEIEFARPNDIEIVSARVVGHGKTKKEPVEQAKVWWGRYSTIGHFYTGELRAPPPSFWLIVEDETRDEIRHG